ncbi:MAG: ABC transporter permease [Nitrososphaera sp.]|nr:ABC transporter permease [Nitrososphaera sp.]
MDFRVQLATRMLFRRKGSLGSASMAVAIAILVIVINSITFEGVANAIIRDLINYRFGHVLVTDRDGNIEKPDREMIGFVENLGYVEGAAVRLSSAASINNTREPVPIRAYGVPLIGVIPEDEQDASKIRQTLSQGSFVAAKNSIVLGDSVARDLQAKIGDPLKLKVTGKNGQDVVKAFYVVGISKTAGGLGFDTSAIIHIDILREMTGRQNESSEMIVRLYDQKDSDKLVRAFISRYPSDRLKAETIEEAGEDILRGIRSGIAFINLVGYFGMLSSAFGIVTIMMMIVASKTREIGIIRAIGSNKANVMIIFVLQGVIIGAIGAAAGFALGSAYTIYADTQDLQFGNSLALEVKYDPYSVLQTCLTGFLMSVAASVYPAWRTTKLEPAEATRY